MHTFYTLSPSPSLKLMTQQPPKHLPSTLLHLPGRVLPKYNALKGKAPHAKLQRPRASQLETTRPPASLSCFYSSAVTLLSSPYNVTCFLFFSVSRRSTPSSCANSTSLGYLTRLSLFLFCFSCLSRSPRRARPVQNSRSTFF